MKGRQQKGLNGRKNCIKERKEGQREKVRRKKNQGKGKEREKVK